MSGTAQDYREKNRRECGYPYKFSIVTAVYNVEAYVAETIESLLAQDIGFEENVQLILVDDGSPDRSGEICDAFARRRPGNITVIHQENAGVSAARNEGLRHVEGCYVNFLDADDKLSPNALRAVYDFFREHDGEMDIVAIPLYFFEASRGQHYLNYKFRKESYVADLFVSPNIVHLHTAASFIRNERARTMSFDAGLAFAEDAKELCKLLVRSHRLGLVPSAKYWYRKRAAGTSALQGAQNNPKWYLPYLRRFSLFALEYAKEQLGFVPLFVQYTVMYDLQWRYRLQLIPEGVLSPEEKGEYRSLLRRILQDIDDSVILNQKKIFREHKCHILSQKYGRPPQVEFLKDDACLYFDNAYIGRISENVTRFEFFRIEGGRAVLEGYTMTIGPLGADAAVFLRVNGVDYPGETADRELAVYSLDERISNGTPFRFSFPLEDGVPRYTIQVVCSYGGRKVPKKLINFGKFFPISKAYQSSFYYAGGYALTWEPSALVVEKCGPAARLRRRLRFMRELLRTGESSDRKAAAVRLLCGVLQFFMRRDIWLVSDRIDRAGDNGEALFCYLRENKIKGRFYFVLQRQSPDYERLRALGPVVSPDSPRYKTLLLLSRYIVSSQGEDFVYQPFYRMFEPYRDLMAGAKRVFLQHGITYNDLSGWLNRYNKNLSLFVTSTARERRAILSGRYYYTGEQVALTGFPRYDLLYRDEKKIITILPTWRKYLCCELNMTDGTRALLPGFEQSAYFNMYAALFGSERLLEAARRLGYGIQVMMHPNMMAAVPYFQQYGQIRFLGKDTAYRKIFAESDLVVTDYSSAVFDFAYLRKPIVYYQADDDEFYSGKHTVARGGFDFERDGFGEVARTAGELVDLLIGYMENGCALKEQYRRRIDETFAFDDRNNCARVYQAIRGLPDASVREPE